MSQLNVGFGLIENYAADLAVTMVFGIGYYLFKGIKNKGEDNWTDPKQNLKNLKGKLEGALQRWQYARTIEDYNELIKTDYEGVEDPFAIINLMNKTGILPTIDTYNALLLNCLLTNNNHAAETLREEILDTTGPVSPNVFTLNVLIKGLNLKYQNLLSCKVHNRRMLYNQFDKELIDLLHDLENRCIYMDGVAQNTILEALVDQERLDEAWNQYMNMKKFYQPDLFTFSTLLKGIQKTPELSDEWLGKAFEILDEAKMSCELDDEFFNDLLEACMKFNRLDKAEELFEEINGRRQLSEATYSIMIKGYTKEYKLDKANEMFNYIRNIAIPSVSTYMIMLNTYVRCKNIDMTERLFDEMINKNVELNSTIYNTMVTGYKSIKSCDKALKLFENVKDKDIVNLNFYNTVLECCVDSNRIDKMTEIYNHLTANKVIVDIRTYSTVIKGYAKSNNPLKVNEIYDSISKKFRLDEMVYNSIIDCFSRNNDETNVLKVYADLRQNDVKMSIITYSVLIKLYCNLGNCNKAFELFDECVKNDLKPNVIIYQMLIKLQVKSRFIDRAITMFRNMQINQVKADNVVYELIIKSCLEHQREKDASEFMISAIKEEIKVEYYLYETLANYLESCFDMATPEKSEICSKLVQAIKEKNVPNVDKRTIQRLNGFIITNPHFYSGNKRPSNPFADKSSYRHERNINTSFYEEEKSIYEIADRRKPKRFNNKRAIKSNTYYEEKSIYL
jgi:pentatricopeptide repeat protein